MQPSVSDLKSAEKRLERKREMLNRFTGSELKEAPQSTIVFGIMLAIDDALNDCVNVGLPSSSVDHDELLAKIARVENATDLVVRAIIELIGPENIRLA